MIENYEDEFSDWGDVQSNFGMDEEKPDAVYRAEYNTPSYEGYAEVYYRRGDKFYHVSGSHCSCYGLEGQWEPDEYDRATFIGMLERRKEPKIIELVNSEPTPDTGAE